MKRLIETLVQDILRSCDPDEILLFGSHAKGLDGVDSDLDLMVIGDFRQAKSLRGRLVEEVVARCPIPVDIHLITPAEMEAEAASPFSFPGSVRSTAISLYQRKKGLAFLPSRN